MGSRKIIGIGECPNCGKEIRVPFPYNVDLHKETPMVICSGCQKHLPVKFILGGELEKFGSIQAIFRANP